MFPFYKMNSLTLSSALDLLERQTKAGRIFWQHHFTVNLTNQPWHGINQLLTGVRPESFQDPVWDSFQLLKNENRHLSEPQNVLKFEDQGECFVCKSIPVVNRGAMAKSKDGEQQKQALPVKPYINARKSRYSGPEARLFINPEEDLAEQVTALAEKTAAPAGKWLSGKWKIPALRIIRDLLKQDYCRICEAKPEPDENITDILADLLKSSQRELAARCFVMTDRLKEIALKRNIPESILSIFLDQDTAYEILNALSPQAVRHLENCMQKCLKNQDGKTAWLHFFSADPDDDAEFYVTGIKDGALTGFLRRNKKNIVTQVAPVTLCQKMQLDVLFAPTELKA